MRGVTYMRITYWCNNLFQQLSKINLLLLCSRSFLLPPLRAGRLCTCMHHALGKKRK